MALDQNNTIMRTVSFVERIEVEFHGNVISQAMVLEDVDNDMGNELVVGNIDGEISIFKGDSPNAWKRATVSGMLTCLAVGKIYLPYKNSLVCMTAEGWCYIFDVTSQPSSQSVLGNEEDPESRLIKPVFTQELPANARVMCLADIDGDDHMEMVIGYSDRVVRAFRWQETPNSDSGQFHLLQKWQLAGQIGSITINYDRDRNPEVMVSQPGATFVTLQVRPTFRHIKSDSCLERLSGSALANKVGLERSGSFALTGAKGSDSSSRGELREGLTENISPRPHQKVGLRKSEPYSNRPDSIASPLSSKVAEDLLQTSLNPTGLFSSPSSSHTRDQQVKSSKESMKMTEFGRGQQSASIVSPSTMLTQSPGRACKSESYLDQAEVPLGPILQASGSNIVSTSKIGAADTVNQTSKTGEFVLSTEFQGKQGSFSTNILFKSSSDELNSDDVRDMKVPGSTNQAQGSLTSNNSPRESQESNLDRSLGRNLDGSFDDDVFKPSIIYHPLAHMQMRNKDTSTVIIGGINRGRPSQSSNEEDEIRPRATYYALATLDGSLILVENDSILWSLQVDHYLFALSKLDVTGNGKEEVVCCSWNGWTYIVNHSKEIVRYQFPDSVAAFCAGSFSLRDGYNNPCFVYATFNNRIYIYPNITLPCVESSNLIKVMGRTKETQDLLNKLNIAENDVDSIRKLYFYCLYGGNGNKNSS